MYSWKLDRDVHFYSSLERDHGVIVENTTVKQLISTLDVETFIFDAAGALPQALPQVDGVHLVRIDSNTFEVEMGRQHDLNTLFAALSAAGITVLSMRNKANRLEELFVRLVDRNKAA